MQLNGYADLLGISTRSRLTSALKARMDVTQKEAVTGLRDDLTMATNGRTGAAHTLLKAINSAQDSQQHHGLAKNRLQLTQHSLRSSREAVNGLDTRALVALEGLGISAQRTLSSEAEGVLGSVISSLNARQGPRYLLSGTNTDSPPVASAETFLDDLRAVISASPEGTSAKAALDMYFNDPAGGFETRIYSGSKTSGTPLFHDGNAPVPLDVRANDPAIRDTLRGLATLAIAEDLAPAGSEEHADIYRNGIESLASGQGGLITLEADTGVVAQGLDRVEQRTQFEILSLSEAWQSLAGRDQFEAAAELKQLEVALQSSYTITARLAGLSLVNFIR